MSRVARRLATTVRAAKATLTVYTAVEADDLKKYAARFNEDHPDIEIFENSKHGHIFLSEGDDWNWDAAPDAWEPGDYRGPVCATCHRIIDPAGFPQPRPP